MKMPKPDKEVKGKKKAKPVAVKSKGKKDKC